MSARPSIRPVGPAIAAECVNVVRRYFAAHGGMDGVPVGVSATARVLPGTDAALVEVGAGLGIASITGTVCVYRDGTCEFRPISMRQMAYAVAANHNHRA